MRGGARRFLDLLRGGERPLGAVVTMTDPAATELVALAGFDFVWLDGEHGILDRATAQAHLYAAEAQDLLTLYRVPCCDHTEIKKIIDLGPDGIIVPMVATATDARRAVAACRYPVQGGDRGTGYRRKAAYGCCDTDGYIAESAIDPLVILQIECVESHRNLDEILAVEGVNAIVVGPYDLSMSLLKPGKFHDPEVAAVYDDICARVKAKGLPLGVYCEADFGIWKRRGVDFFTIKNDTNAMVLGFERMREIYKEETK